MAEQKVEIPYPAVFRDWRRPEERAAVTTGDGGVRVEMLVDWKGAASVWRQVELTEDDAALMAAALLRNAGHGKLSRRVLRKLGKQDVIDHTTAER